MSIYNFCIKHLKLLSIIRTQDAFDSRNCCSADTGEASTPTSRVFTSLRSSFFHFRRSVFQERLRDIQRVIHDIDEGRRHSENNIQNLTRVQQQLHQHQQAQNNTFHHSQKVKGMYKTCLQDAIAEETSIRKALSKIQEIRNIRNERRIQARNAGNKEAIRRGALMKMVQISAQTLPLFVSKLGEKVPPLCGAIPAESNYIAKVGDNVAALVKGVEDEENWILAEVVQFLHRQNKYDVIDIDEEQKDRHVLSKRKIIPLPLMRANPETDAQALFPKDTIGKSNQKAFNL